MNFADLVQRLVAASRASFADLIGQRSAERFYAFILYTDADCYTVLPSANSLEKHREKIARQGIDRRGEAAGYQWSIGEWAYEAWADEGFEPICQDLSVASQAACQTGTFAAFQCEVHAAMIKALAVLDEEGFFDPIRSDPNSSEVVLFVSSSDADAAFDLENASASILNAPEVHARFVNRYTVAAS